MDINRRKSPDITYTPAQTSGRHVARAARVAMRTGLVHQGTVVLDYGAGRYRETQMYLETIGACVYAIDPYTISPACNMRARQALRERGGADITIVSNVLNVIPTPWERETVLSAVNAMTRDGGTILLTMYEGDRSFVGREVVVGKTWHWQENRPTSSYHGEIAKFFSTRGTVTCRERAIVVRKS